MIDSIKQFFNAFIEPNQQETELDRVKGLQIATAALLIEMMHMDKTASADEQHAVSVSLQTQFGLDAAQLEMLLTLAEQEAREASGYYEFTALINANCSSEQKIRIIENMWQVAMSDGYLDAHEEHLMRKIAGLLYVAHADYIAAKLRARQSIGVEPV